MSTLVIGYGSELRGDDAVGRHVADAVHQRGLPDVVVRSLHQLGPELAVDLGEVDLVVFVDADVTAQAITVRPLSPAPERARTTHHLRPEVLLALTAALGLPVPRAFALGIPARHLDLAVTLSPDATAQVGPSLEALLDLIATERTSQRVATQGRSGAPAP